MFEWIETIEHNGKKVTLHFIGDVGNLSLMVTSNKGTTIAHGKTFEEVKAMALERIDFMCSRKYKSFYGEF